MSRKIANTKIREVMKTDVVTVTKETTIRELKDAFERWDYNAFPVVDGENVVGIVTKMDLLKAFSMGLSVSRRGIFNLWASKVADVMRTAVVSVGPDHTVEKTVEYMVEFKLRSIPVIEGRKLVGIVSRTDLMPYLLIVEDDDGP